MIKHIVMWKFRDELSKEEKQEARLKIKKGLENLINLIPGIVEIEVAISFLNETIYDAALYSAFQSEEALKAYQVHPEHQKIRTFVHSVVEKGTRNCIDFDI